MFLVFVDVDVAGAATTTAPVAVDGGGPGALRLALFGALALAAATAAVLAISGPRMTSRDDGPGAPARPGGTPAGRAGDGPRPAEPPGPIPVPRDQRDRPTLLVATDAEVQATHLRTHRLRPRDLGGVRTWAEDRGTYQAAALWLEKVPGRGEDAEPTLIHDHKRSVGLLAVYDGLGGSGSTVARRLADGRTLSDAYLAPRLVRAVTERWFGLLLERGRPDSRPFPKHLGDIIAGALADEMPHLDDDGSDLKGSLARRLPTTMAAALVRIDQDGSVAVLSMWAGDSRVFALRPATGLHQLTRDDTRVRDALEQLRTDAPMSNVIAADRPFTLNGHSLNVRGPVVVVAATDGCFAHVTTPAHFEHLLLSTLQDAWSMDTWAARLARHLERRSSDDSSLVIQAHGFGSFAALQATLARRADEVAQAHWAPFAAARDDRAAHEAARVESWAQYRRTYEALMPPEDQP